MPRYRKRNKGGSQPSVAAPGGICQSRLINPDYSNARQEISCPNGTTCLRNNGAPIKSNKKATFSKWTDKSIYEKFKGTCKDPSNKKSSVSRAWKKTKNTVKGTVKTVTRMPSLSKLCGFLPNQPETEGLNFSKNIWRNLKRNMVLLSAIPSEKLESQFLPADSKELKDYQNLLERMKNHNVNLNPSNYDNPEEDDNNPNNMDGGKRTIKRKRLKNRKNKNRTKKL